MFNQALCGISRYVLACSRRLPSAVLASAFPQIGIACPGSPSHSISLFLTMSFTVGGISGGHFNPAVSLGLAVAGRVPAASVVAYVIAQEGQNGTGCS